MRTACLGTHLFPPPNALGAKRFCDLASRTCWSGERGTLARATGRRRRTIDKSGAPGCQKAFERPPTIVYALLGAVRKCHLGILETNAPCIL